MDKSQNLRVEALALRGKGCFFAAAVYSITQQGMPVPGQMDSDLVGSAGLQTAFNIGIVSEALQYPDMSDRLSAIGAHCHFFSVRGVASDRLRNSDGILADISQYDGPVSADNSVFSQLSTIMLPVVSLSIRCTIPGRRTPLIPDRDPLQW